MHYFAIIIGICWLVFVGVWFVSAFKAKRNLRTSWRQNAWLRIIIAIVVYLIFRQQIEGYFSASHTLYAVNPIIGAVGTLLCMIGTALAIWARLHIGTNWGMPMSLKENRELITSGPYHYIRHPIYAGLMLAMIGAALVIGPWLLIAFLIYFIYFIYSATSEEKTLAKEFPEEYAAYKKRTKMLIPFIL